MPQQGAMRIVAGPLEKELTRLVRQGTSKNLVPEIMARRPEVYSNKNDLKKLIGNRLGWVDVASTMSKQIVAIDRFGQSVFRDGIKHVVLMGMGGSSLCPEVFKLMFGKHPRLKSFSVLDSTDPVAVKALERKIDLKRTLFIVASKSGGTVETRSHEAYFMGRLRQAGVKRIGPHFAAITDSGSGLEQFAKKNRYRKIFVNPSDIGGRYSALSYFGLVPGYFAGVDLKKLLADAIMMENLLRFRRDESNPALTLGALMAAGYRSGQDKLTFIASRSCAPFIPWVEQLIAESTGKKHRGVVPIEGEPVGSAGDYCADRLHVVIRMAGEKSPARFLQHDDEHEFSSIEITLGDRYQLGRQFLLWEAATAAAGFFMGINPFDEPNVTESKENTTMILAKRQATGHFPYETPLSSWGKLSLIAAGGISDGNLQKRNDPIRFLRTFFAKAQPPKYVSLLNYYQSDRRTEQEVARIRRFLRGETHVATLRGYGPRFLHSIGQLYKGGPQDGMFIVFVRKRYDRLAIPGREFDFGQLITAQALGDSQALIKRKLPTVVLAIDGNVADGLAQFSRLLHAALR